MLYLRYVLQLCTSCLCHTCCTRCTCHTCCMCCTLCASRTWRTCRTRCTYFWRDVQQAQAKACATKHSSTLALAQAPQREPPNSVWLGWAQIIRPRQRAYCAHAGSDSLLQHHSGQASPLSEASSYGRRWALFERRRGGAPTPFPLLFPDVSTTTKSPTDSNPEPSSLHWAQRPMGFFVGGGSPLLPAAAAVKSESPGATLIACITG